MNAKKIAMFAGGVLAVNVALEVLAIKGVWDWHSVANMFAGAIPSVPTGGGAEGGA